MRSKRGVQRGRWNDRLSTQTRVSLDAQGSERIILSSIRGQKGVAELAAAEEGGKKKKRTKRQRIN